MKLVVIDGQGGRLGRMIVESVLKEELDCQIYAIGTNSTATAAMMKAGAAFGATGENPVVVACRDADIIAGPIGIVVADSLLGEVTPKMACAVGQSSAVKLLIPIAHCSNQVVGVKSLTMNEMVEETVAKIRRQIAEGCSSR